jgi:tetratricopeptide (TPR) repeat protein
MELLLLLNSLLGVAIGGIIGNRADHIFCRVMQEVVNRLRQGGSPVNHDLQRAVRGAYLRATRAVCHALYEERGVPPQVWRHDLRTVLRRPDEIRWLDKVCRWINEELRQLPKATYQPPSTDADHQIELLLQPKGTTAEQRAKELADKLKQSLLEEVRRFGEPPERFVQMIQQGWTLTQPDKTEVRLDWFDLLCASFVNTLKTTPKVRAIFEGKLLANLAVESVPITLDQIDQLFSRKVSEEIVQQIQESERRLAQLMAEGFEASRKREEAILDFLRQTFGSQHLVIALQGRTRTFIDRIGTQAFVPREGALQQLENWLTRESGVAILHAPAGYGKTTFLANLVKASREAGDTRVVYHFFSKDPDLGGYATSLGNALAHLLGQVAAITDSSHSREGLYASAVDPDSRRAQLENTIQELKLAEGERLLIVLDGLDEADETLHPPLRKPLPAGVFVVVSGRWDGAGNPPDYLQHWLEIADEIIPIDAMSASEIAQWLQQAGDGELRAYADDDAFVQQILEKTDGLPLFLDFLLDDLLQAAKQSQNVRQVLHQTPTGFSNYVRQQFRQLAASVGQQPAVRTLFGILSVSKGALREDEIAKLTGLSGWDLAALPSQATRWWRIGGEDGKRTYSFAHPLLAVEFAKVLGSEAERARQSLLAWCAEWQTHKSPYALRHYAEHLREAKQVDALYALARDEAFAHAQREGVPNDPDLPRQTAALALQAAIEREDVPTMAEMLLLHARRVETIENPLEALRAGNPQRALKLAERILREQDYQIGTLWLLLLAWESSNRENGSEFVKQCLTLIREWWIANRPQPLSDDWAPVVVKVLLQFPCAHAAELAVILHDGAKVDLVRGLLELGLCPPQERVELAFQVAGQIENAYERSETYGAVAEALVQVGDVVRSQSVFTEAMKAAGQIANAFWRSRAYCELAIALAQVGQVEQAVQIARQIEDTRERSEACWETALALARAGQVEQALQVARQIRDIHQRSWAYLEVAVVLAEIGQVEQAVRVAKHIAGANERSQAYCSVAAVLAQAGQVEQALQIVRQLRDVYWRSWAYRGVAAALAEMGQVEQALQAFNLALQAAGKIAEVYLQVSAYREMAIALAEMGQVEQALQAFNLALQAAGKIAEVYLQVSAYREMAIALAEMGQVEQALQAFNLALQVAERSSNADKNSWVYRGMAQALAKAGQTELALQMVEQVASARERMEVYCEVAVALARVGKVDQALQVVKQIADADRRFSAYREIAFALIEVGQVEHALQVAEQITNVHSRLEVYSKVSAALTETSLVELSLQVGIKEREVLSEVLLLAGQSADAYLRSEAYCEVAIALAQAGQIEQALRAFNEALQWAGHVTAAYKRSEAYHKVALGLTQSGQVQQALHAFNKALQTVELVSGTHLRSLAYRELGMALARAGDVERALQTYDKALKSAEQISDASWRALAYREIAIHLAEVGHGSQALLVASQIEDIDKRALAYGALGIAIMQSGQMEQGLMVFEEALEAAEQITDADRRLEVYARVLAMLSRMVRSGEAQEVSNLALQMAEQIADANNRSRACGVLVSVLSRLGQVEQSLQVARQIMDTEERSRAYCEIALALAQVGDRARSQRAFDEALKAAEQIANAFWRSWAYCEIALALAQAGDGMRAQVALEQALKAAKEIGDAEERSDALWEVWQTAAESGCAEWAHRLGLYELPVERREKLAAIMATLAQRSEKATFLALLPLCGWSLGMAIKASLLLAKLYPQHNLAVLELLARELGISGDSRSDDESA